ncbi:uncharacterized protein K452DRAFT_220412 [Aplosporella prunicola CBS 121167]|uniref:Rhodopsin domain-containing protein n=1 Tax=Aplosporella prunicola CBS 121167 TaxID=1176127 RepID=A0A6A6BRW5_9PEZI|nr:uncharacterized protein K452DRAFT_220412 [Aplosporella prunicola CBS 121167]KAF2145321.1 hypothetical protein K452DRAFT_220412 [Aplosporella prunicola CBS 121167]
MSSALIGSPPETQNDYWIVEGMLRAVHMDTRADPGKGYNFLPKQPQGYEYEDRKTATIIGMSFVMFIMIIATGTRLSVRLFRSGLRWGSDDWMLIPGAIMAIAYPALQIAMVVYGGGGKHTWDVTYEEYNIFNWLGVVCKILFFTSVGIIKISITLFNRRLTGMASRIWRIINDVFLVMLIAYTILALFWTCFQCTPPPAMWDKAYSGRLARPASCYSTSLLSNVLSTLHVIMDFCLLMTPIIVLWKVKLPKSTKIRLYFVFSTGAVSCIGSVLRQLAQQKISLDVTWGYTSILTWTLVDLTFGLLTASLPVIVGLIPSAWHSVTNREASRPTNISQGYLSESRSKTTRSGRDVESESGVLIEEEFELSWQSVDRIRTSSAKGLKNVAVSVNIRAGPPGA